MCIRDSKKGKASKITVGAYHYVRGKNLSGEKLSKLYCQSFQKYRARFSGDVFQRINSIKTSNVQSAHCNYQVQAKKILFFQSGYKGRKEATWLKNKKTYVDISYFDKKIKLIDRSATLILTHVSGDFTHVWSTHSLEGNARSFHRVVRDDSRKQNLAFTKELAQLTVKP